MSARKERPEKRPDELYITRIYDAPVKAVWDAWVDPAQVAKWWGPRGFTLTTHAKDLRPGGHWTYTMHGPDGKDWPNKTFYHEVIEHQRLVYDHGANDDQPPLFRVTVEFTDLKGRTRMEMTMRCASAETADATRQFVKKAGGDSTWDRLAEYLEDSAGGRDVFVINRSFKADIHTVFEMWSNPRHLAKWMGPTGSSMSLLEADVRDGGGLHYEMTNAGGLVMYGKLAYRKIRQPDLLVYTQSFCDKEGKLTKPPFAPTWPDAMLTTVTFAEEGPDETRVTVHWQIDGDATDVERTTFHDAKAGMTGGWTGSFDKLDEVLWNR